MRESSQEKRTYILYISIYINYIYKVQTNSIVTESESVVAWLGTGREPFWCGGYVLHLVLAVGSTCI